MGVDRDGGYAIPFLTCVGGDHARWEGSRAPLGLGFRNHSLFRAGREHDILIHVRIAIGHLAPPAGSEYQDGNCRNGSGSHTRPVCPELCAGDGLSWRRVTYALGPSHKPSKIARFPRRPAPAPRVGRK